MMESRQSQEDNHVVYSLQDKGTAALRQKDPQSALQFYNEALAVDTHSFQCLLGRIQVYLQLDEFLPAQRDTELLISIDPDNIQGYCLQATILEKLGYHHEALVALLQALERESPLDENLLKIANRIAMMAGILCDTLIVAKLLDMDPYRKLCSVGIMLYRGDKYDLCIKVLSAIRRLSTTETDITLQLLLTLANAHSALKQRDSAIAAYEELLELSKVCCEQQYQMKALVNLASLCLETEDYQLAVVHYLHLLQIHDESTPPVLMQALHLNLSICFKHVGDMQQAMKHARKYVHLIEVQQGANDEQLAHAHYNIGLLHEILGERQVSLEHYQRYLSLSEAKGLTTDVKRAYGCLSSIHAQLGNAYESADCHAVLITLTPDGSATRVEEELHGDNLMLLGLAVKAEQAFLKALSLSQRGDATERAILLCKLGSALRSQGRNTDALWRYQVALALADESDLKELETVCRFNIAELLQYSYQGGQLEHAQELLVELIQQFEAQIQHHIDTATFCSSELEDRLRRCSTALQRVLIRLGSHTEALLQAETFKQRYMSSLVPTSQPGLCSPHDTWSAQNSWTLARVMQVVNRQPATVIYFSLLQSHILIWLIQPGVGLVDFYAHPAASADTNLEQEINQLTTNIKQVPLVDNINYQYEGRSLPTRTSYPATIIPSRKVNIVKPSETTVNTNDVEEEEIMSAERELFACVLAPLQYSINQLKKAEPIIIIPDKQLFRCPIMHAINRYNISLQRKFRVTYLPNLFLLDKIYDNEEHQINRLHELHDRRVRARHGGIRNVLHSSSTNTNHHLNEHKQNGIINKKSISFKRHYSNAASSHVSKASAVTHVSIARNSTWKDGDFERSLGEQVDSVKCKIRHDMRNRTIGTLTTVTSTRTDITTSDVFVTPFQQVSNPEKVVVIGSPLISTNVQLHGKQWKHNGILKRAQMECCDIAKYCGISPILGRDATKERFLEELKTSTVMHIATFACIQEGLIAFAPNEYYSSMSETPEEAYLVTSAEIVACGSVAQLVVLSSGWIAFERNYIDEGFKLASAFIMAGAQCVVTLLWQIPDAALTVFYKTFYSALQTGNLVTTAFSQALQHMQQHDKYSDIGFWSPFILIGKDVCVNLGHLRCCMLDQLIDQQEAVAIENMKADPIHCDPINPTMPSREHNLQLVQQCFSGLLSSPENHQAVVQQLKLMIKGCLKHLSEKPAKKEVRKPGTPIPVKERKLNGPMKQTASVLRLLTLLGFSFQSFGGNQRKPFVIYPHSDNKSLLRPVCDAAYAAIDLMQSAACCSAIADILPASQSTISNLVDVLCITKHAPELQLKVTDVSVRSLWKNVKVKVILTRLGFQQIGPLLHFNSLPATRTLLTATLKLFISLSVHKSRDLLDRLDVKLLGGPYSSKASIASIENLHLPSLTPVILPQNQLQITTPWMSVREKDEEMKEKMKLEKSKCDLREQYAVKLHKAKTWHQLNLEDNPDEARLESTDEAQISSTSDIKANTMSLQPSISLFELDELRGEAHFVLHQRLDDISLQHRNDVKKLFLPYVQNKA